MPYNYLIDPNSRKALVDQVCACAWDLNVWMKHVSFEIMCDHVNMQFGLGQSEGGRILLGIPSFSTIFSI